MTQHNLGTPAHNWATGHERKKDGTSWLPAMLVGAFIFAIGCGSGLIVGWVGGVASNFGDMSNFAYEPAAITIQTQAPQSVIVGEPFTVTLSISDIASNQRTIRDIDWSGPIVDNMQFGAITPAPVGDTPDAGYREMVFEQTLGADASMDFSYELTARQPGIYSANITVYVDDYNSESTSIEIEVLDEE